MLPGQGLSGRRTRVNSVAPGPTGVGSLTMRFERFPEVIPPIGARTAFERLGDGDDVGRVTAALSKHASTACLQVAPLTTRSIQAAPRHPSLSLSGGRRRQLSASRRSCSSSGAAIKISGPFGSRCRGKAGAALPLARSRTRPRSLWDLRSRWHNDGKTMPAVRARGSGPGLSYRLKPQTLCCSRR